jgi:hypothetical protein
VKDSVDFCQKLETQEIAEDEIMVSFDVVALFPSILIDTALEFMNDWLTTIRLEDEKRRSYMEVAECCMKLNYFMFRNEFYQQTTGTSMGNPLSPIIANIFMSRFEIDLAESNYIAMLMIFCCNEKGRT